MRWGGRAEGTDGKVGALTFGGGGATNRNNTVALMEGSFVSFDQHESGETAFPAIKLSK